MATNDLDFQIRKRIEELADWLQREDAATLRDQKHLDAGTIERLYWHLGYYAALNDVEQRRLSKEHSEDTAPMTRVAARGARSYH